MRRSARGSIELGATGRLRIWWIAVILAIAAGGTWWATSGRPKASVGAPALGQRIPDEGAEHVAVGAQLQDKVDPPASGPHYPIPAPAGVYPNGPQTGFWVHNLEHGYVVLLYRPPVPPECLLEFYRMVKEFPRSKFGNVELVIAPYSALSHAYAALAWDWRLDMDAFDRAAVLQFYKQRVDRGREDER